MFSQPKFGQKIALMPALAGLGAVVVLVVALALGARSQASLSAIEEGYSPSLESSRTLEQTMASFQRSLQDAVAAGDTEAVVAADSPAGLFRAELVTLRTNPVVDDAEIDELMAAFHSYAELASATSRQMITGQGRGDLMSNLTRMTGSYSALGEALATRTERDRERIALAFADARDLQSTSTGATVIILMVVVVALALLSFWIIRNVLGALKAIGESAIEIAQGKIDQTIDYESSDKIGVVADAFRGLIAYIQSVAETADNLARGDISVRIEPRSDHDVLSRNMARATATLQAVLEEAGGLISAAESGQLQRRGDPGAYDGAYGELVLGMNQMLDALGVPLTEASAVLGGMARGDHDHTHAGCVRGQLR